MNLEIFDDADGVAAAAAELLIAATGNVVLSGGSTPKKAYAIVAERRTDWSGTRLWLGDERYVPATDEHANVLMAQRALGAAAPIEGVDTELALDAAAAEYEERLLAALEGRAGVDLALMGLGPDGHTASLFPGKPAVNETERYVIGVPEAGMEPRVPRVTLTLPVFDAARKVVFLVAGEDKAEAMERAFGEPRDETAPAALVRPQEGELIVLADRAAAARLT
ncbi:MAG: 6-phosphogluconolactonase [Solirubrobacteraceae bacterium]|jgi:6-phosphogluconolactonase|nr:6-phosphogluconolactonase [Solirubrobacteraceae bacterium]